MYMPTGFLKSSPRVRRQLRQDVDVVIRALEDLDELLQGLGVVRENAEEVKQRCAALAKNLYPIHVLCRDLVRQLTLIETKAAELQQ